jgi:two-component system chemotaxis response regulator CheB
MNVSAARRIRVLIVEDSPTVRQLLEHILNADPALQVIGHASDGDEAVELVRQQRPDIVTMDLHMPRMNGIEAVRIIMETAPTPIVVVSGQLAPADLDQTFQALTAGALAVVEKPAGLGGDLALRLVQTVKLMAEVKVVRRWPKRSPPAAKPLLPDAPRAGLQLVAIGASTGGPLILHSILSGLAGRIDVPIVVVQHIANGFTAGFADWLSKTTGMPVCVGRAGEHLQPGRAYIAPDAMHMSITTALTIGLSAEPPENGHRPSVSHLFRATAQALGRNAVGVMLSGMGRDGAEEMRQMADRGAVTIAQDPQTAVVGGMPGEAIKLGGAQYVLAPEKITKVLLELLGGRH